MAGSHQHKRTQEKKRKSPQTSPHIWHSGPAPRLADGWVQPSPPTWPPLVYPERMDRSPRTLPLPSTRTINRDLRPPPSPPASGPVMRPPAPVAFPPFSPISPPCLHDSPCRGTINRPLFGFFPRFPAEPPSVVLMQRARRVAPDFPVIPTGGTVARSLLFQKPLTLVRLLFRPHSNF